MTPKSGPLQGVESGLSEELARCASYDEAREIRREHGGSLLACRRHFFIVDRHCIEFLGIDPDDPDWQHIGRDWARPADPASRQRLYGWLINAG